MKNNVGRPEVLERVIEIIWEDKGPELKLDKKIGKKNNIIGEHELAADLDFDSLDLGQLFMLVEEEFEVSLDGYESKIKTVDNLVDFIFKGLD